VDVVEPAVVLSAGENATAPSLRHRIEWWGLRLVLLASRALSVEQVSAAGAFLLGRVGPRLRQNRRALANLAIAFPEMPEAERHRIARAMWANMGRTFAETLVLDRLLQSPDRIEIVDRAAWTQRAAEPGTIVGITLHMGSWELAIQPFNMLGRQPSGVYKPLDNPLIDAWLKRTRAPLFPSGLFGKGDRADSDGTGQRTARQLIDKARSGGMLGFVADHFDRRGDAVAFLGRTTKVTTAPAGIARHVGARVWVGRCVRVEASCRFRFEMTELPVPRSQDRKADALALTAAVFAVFEAWIREHPEQWMWWNTRWVEARAEAEAHAPEHLKPVPGRPA
jgi:KDO2-lipid IV(A) lauroyltransferase